MKILDEKFKNNLLRYVFQCFLATVTISAVLMFLNVITETAIIAALGASTFIIFTMPNSYSSDPRRLIGGYFVGISVGMFFSILLELNVYLINFSNDINQLVIFGAISVGISIFIMTITNTEHAPATGISLGLVINPWSLETIIFIIVAIVWLYTIKRILQPYLIDLRSNIE